MNILAILCAATAWLVTRRARQHRPVALALTVCAGLDVFRAHAAPHPRIDMALCLVAPAVSAWAYVHAFGGPFPAARGYLTFTCGLFILALDGRWDWILPATYLVAVVSGVSAYADAHERGSWPGWTVTQAVALALLAGDVAGLVLLCRREWISYQAGVVLGLVTLYQVGWYWRSYRAEIER